MSNNYDWSNIVMCEKCGKGVPKSEFCIECGHRLGVKYISTNFQSQSQTPPTVKCPKCGSTQIQLVPRKWSIITGIFTNQVDRMCLNCKHKF